MSKLIFENAKGNKVELGQKAPYLLKHIDGAGGAEVDVQTQKAAYQDGETHIDSLLDPRDIDIEGVVLAEDEEHLYLKRKELLSIFNPKLGKGNLIYTMPDGERKIEAVVDSPPLFPSGKDNKGKNHQKFTLTLFCPSPFWEDIKETGEPLGFIEGGLTFPLMLNPDVEEHTLFSRRGFTSLLENKGDVPAPVEITFSGPAENPKIINKTTGEFIQINDTLDSDEKLIINTAFGAKRAEIEGNNGEMQNAFHYLDLESTFWELQVGDNEIDFESDISREEASVLISIIVL